jgi:hypothetical protein
MLMSIGLFLGNIGVVLFIIGMFILWPLFWLITGRYFDNKLGFKQIYNPIAKGNILPGFLMRALQYCTLIVLRRGAKKSYDRMVFGETDFRAIARKSDVIASFIFGFFFFGGLFILVIATIFIGGSKLIAWL